MAEQNCGVASHVAEPLDDQLLALEFERVAFRPINDAMHDSLARGFDSPNSAATRYRFPCDNSSIRLIAVSALGVEVCIHRPSHDLLIGTHIGCGDISVCAAVCT